MTQALEHHRFRPWADLRSCPALDDSGPRRWNEEAILTGSECRVRLEVDPFDDRVPAGYRTALLDLMKATPQISWIVTTEFPDAVRELAGDFVEDWPANVWLGVRVSRQSDADKDVPALLELPVPVRFADCSPLTGPVDLRWVFDPKGFACCGGGRHCSSDGGCPLSTWPREADGSLARLHWVLAAGGEGVEAKPMHPDWARALRDSCAHYGVRFYFAGSGEWQCVIEEPGQPAAPSRPLAPDERYLNLEGGHGGGPRRLRMRMVGRMFSAQDLDGVEHRELPDAVTTQSSMTMLGASAQEAMRPRARP